jgi:hypothetical protein
MIKRKSSCGQTALSLNEHLPVPCLLQMLILFLPLLELVPQVSTFRRANGFLLIRGSLVHVNDFHTRAHLQLTSSGAFPSKA